MNLIQFINFIGRSRQSQSNRPPVSLNIGFPIGFLLEAGNPEGIANAVFFENVFYLNKFPFAILDCAPNRPWSTHAKHIPASATKHPRPLLESGTGLRIRAILRATYLQRAPICSPLTSSSGSASDSSVQRSETSASSHTL